MTLRVGVLGAQGRMGSEACRAVQDAGDLELVASLGRGDDLDALLAAGVEVAVELTTPASVMDNVRFCVEHGISVVVGTSGMGEDRLREVSGWLAGRPDVGVLVAPNFALGAVLLMRFAAMAAPWFESVEIVELHHPAKLDAPSGTARHTAEAVAAARAAAGRGPSPDATESRLDGARGATVAGVPVHAVRLRGVVASEEVLLGSAGEVLTLRHDSVDRTSFMPGLLLAVRRVRERPGLTVGLDAVMDLDSPSSGAFSRADHAGPRAPEDPAP